LPPAKIDDTIELLNIKLDRRHLHVDPVLISIDGNNLYALIPIVEKSVCSDTYCCAPMTNRWGGAEESTHPRRAIRRKRERRRYCEV